ncbi:MAG: 3-dehydroquinate synthase [Proteobacteria bacterium]|nr:3-dehydroquinate synthase [Pseudomonadota bacterium]
MEEFTLNISYPEREVKILTGKNALVSASSYINSTFNSKVVLTNKNIWNIWKEYFSEHIKDFYLFQIEDGEKYKNYKTVSEIYKYLVSIGATRKTAFIGFGGGVIGDIAGFVASTYHRGIPLIHVPTTLLAQVDSSIGGKTGYNLREGKNLVGTFYQPNLIVSDSLFLHTLSEREFKSGLAEVIKAGFIMDYKLIDLIESNLNMIKKRDENIISEIMKRAQLVKIKVVKEDVEEQGLRAILNFGHTLGHGIEVLTRWKVPHGYAVAAGMGFAIFLSFSMGYITKGEMIRAINLLKGMGYRLLYKLDYTMLESVIKRDKKKKEDLVEWVLLKSIGKAEFGIKLDMNYIKGELKNYEKFILSDASSF